MKDRAFLSGPLPDDPSVYIKTWCVDSVSQRDWMNHYLNVFDLSDWRTAPPAVDFQQSEHPSALNRIARKAALHEGTVPKIRYRSTMPNAAITLVDTVMIISLYS